MAGVVGAEMIAKLTQLYKAVLQYLCRAVCHPPRAGRILQREAEMMEAEKYAKNKGHEKAREMLQAALIEIGSLRQLLHVFDDDTTESELRAAGIWNMEVKVLECWTEHAPKVGEIGRIACPDSVSLSTFNLSSCAPVCGLQGYPDGVGVPWCHLAVFLPYPADIAEEMKTLYCKEIREDEATDGPALIGTKGDLMRVKLGILTQYSADYPAVDYHMEQIGREMDEVLAGEPKAASTAGQNLPKQLGNMAAKN